MARRSSKRSEPGDRVTVTPAGQDRERGDEELLHDAAARLRRATLIPVLMLGPLIFLPLRTPPELLAPRAINLGLHLAVTLLAFALVRRLVARALVAPATALLFAVHPIHVEAIAIPSARTELLSTALSLTALLCFTHAGTSRVAGRIAAPGTGGRHAAAWLAGVCLFLGLTVSPTTLAVPPLLLGLNYLIWPRAGSSAPGWWTAKLSAYIPAAVALLTFLALRSMGLFSTPYSPLGAGAGSGVASALSLFVRQVGVVIGQGRHPFDLVHHPGVFFGVDAGTGVAVGRSNLQGPDGQYAQGKNRHGNQHLNEGKAPPASFFPDRFCCFVAKHNGDSLKAHVADLDRGG